jgi:hypothetical protein
MKNIKKLSKEYNELTTEYLDNLAVIKTNEIVLLESKKKLNNKKFEIIRDNPDKKLGSNEKEREANLDLLLKEEKENVQDQEMAIDEVKHNIQLIQIKFSNLKFQLECLKLIEGDA